MASYKRKLKDREGNFVLPATRSTCVYMNSGIDLQTYLDNLSDNLQAHWDEMLTKDALYPVGSIFHSTSSTSPASLFGGSWTQIQGRMLIGQNSTYTNMDTGGEATHILSTSEIPAHTHGSKILTGQGPEIYASKNVHCSGIVTETVTVADREYTQNGGRSNRWIKWSINASHGAGMLLTIICLLGMDAISGEEPHKPIDS